MNHTQSSTCASAYYPSTKQYTMTDANSAQLYADMSSRPGYTSMYSGVRNDFDDLAVRKDTYLFHPRSEVPMASMAGAGFYFTGNNDVSQCYKCGLKINRLSRGTDPMAVHRQRAPNCAFVRSHAAASEHRHDSESSDCIDGVESDSDLASDVEMDGADEEDETVLSKIDRTCNYRTDNARYVETCASAACAPAPCYSKPRIPTAIDKEELRQENARLRSTITCRKCNKSKVQTLFLPCRHLVTCEDCAEKMDDCISCGQKILGTVRTYLI